MNVLDKIIVGKERPAFDLDGQQMNPARDGEDLCELSVTPATVWALVEEVIAARRQVKALQARMTEMVEAQPHRRVHAFMTMAGQALPNNPAVPADDVVRTRLRLIAEEFCELLAACGDIQTSDQTGEHYSEVEDTQARLEWLISKVKIRVDLPEFADALADLDYVVEGTRLAFGIYGPPIAAEVHRANMAKMGGKLREDGKFTKPEGWTAPDVAGELKRQGWRAA